MRTGNEKYSTRFTKLTSATIWDLGNTLKTMTQPREEWGRHVPFILTSQDSGSPNAGRSLVEERKCEPVFDSENGRIRKLVNGECC